MIWRYFAWTNQTLAAVVLWAITIYLAQSRKAWWVTVVPAMFMTAVITTYILIAPEGFRLPFDVSVAAGIAAALLLFGAFEYYRRRLVRGTAAPEIEGVAVDR